MIKKYYLAAILLISFVLAALRGGGVHCRRDEPHTCKVKQNFGQVAPAISQNRKLAAGVFCLLLLYRVKIFIIKLCFPVKIFFLIPCKTTK